MATRSDGPVMDGPASLAENHLRQTHKPIVSRKPSPRPREIHHPLQTTATRRSKEGSTRGELHDGRSSCICGCPRCHQRRTMVVVRVGVEHADAAATQTLAPAAALCRRGSSNSISLRTYVSNDDALLISSSCGTNY
ncbi:hypothetical protein PVAP13_5NG545601 [Panicum virgatum]|uniref:Uncharacterized protein n=1 Tax=Panicum virgatum TaxID=38727 RepID=A0A8T0S670_PANVG|nr:hypothetical protein PVAP13_5NG545601 [Panicum virgatum]